MGNGTGCLPKSTAEDSTEPFCFLTGKEGVVNRSFLRLLYMLCSERLRFENEEKEDLDEGFEIPDTPESSLASASYSGFLGVFWDGLVIICKILIRVNSHPSERKERTVYHYSIEYLHYDLFQR
jgi:hypothetical protein